MRRGIDEFVARARPDDAACRRPVHKHAIMVKSAFNMPVRALVPTSAASVPNSAPE
jgi:hypothetical protein